MPLLAGTGQQAYIALLCFLTGAATAPLYEWTRPLKRKNKASEFALDLFYMLVAGGIFLLFTHTALKGILSFYTAISFFAGAAAGAFVLRKTQTVLIKLFRPVWIFLKSHVVSALPKKAENAVTGVTDDLRGEGRQKRENASSMEASVEKSNDGVGVSRNGTKANGSGKLRRFGKRRRKAIVERA